MIVYDKHVCFIVIATTHLSKTIIANVLLELLMEECFFRGQFCSVIHGILFFCIR